jgi:hypothetical protein
MKVTEILTTGYGGDNGDRHDRDWDHHHWRRYWDRSNDCWSWRWER